MRVKFACSKNRKEAGEASGKGSSDPQQGQSAWASWAELHPEPLEEFRPQKHPDQIVMLKLLKDKAGAFKGEDKGRWKLGDQREKALAQKRRKRWRWVERSGWNIGYF